MLPEQGDLHVLAAPKDPAIIELQEAGIEIDLVDRKPDVEIKSPLRYGVRLIDLTTDTDQTIVIRRALPGHPVGRVIARLVCSPNAKESARIEWLRRTDRVAKLLGGRVVGAQLDTLRANLEDLRSSAPDAEAQARATHLVAQAEYLSGNAATAVSAFKRAEIAWMHAGHPERAAVARIGVVEESVRIGRYEDALTASIWRGSTQRISPYVLTRLQYGRCLALKELGRFPAAESCYSTILKRFKSLDERSEYLSTLQGYAALEQEVGKPGSAERLIRQVIEKAEGPYADIVRGRARLTLFDLLLSQADVHGALAQANAALSDFGAAKDPRWQANTWLKTAVLYRQLGTYDEAYAAVGQALQHFPPRDAPARIAASLLVLGSIDRATQRYADALRWFAGAESLYTSLAMPEERESAALARAQVLLETGSASAAAHIFGADNVNLPFNATAKALLGIKLALANGDVATAAEEIERQRHLLHDLASQVDLDRLDAQRWRISGSGAHADGVLWSAMQRIQSIAASVNSETLRELVLRQRNPLQMDALRALLERMPRTNTAAAPGSMDDRGAASDDRDSTSDYAWRWLAASAPTRSRPTGITKRYDATDSNFGNAVASELLGTSKSIPTAAATAQLRAQRSLISVLAGRADPLSENPVYAGMPITSLQQVLPTGGAFVAYLDAGDRAALLLVTPSSSRIFETAAASELRTAQMTLRALLRSPNSATSQIDEAAQRLSELLFVSMSDADRPSRLLVLANSVLDATPWGLLRWPGHQEALIETTDVRVVRVGPSSACPDNCEPPHAHVIVASQERSSEPSLPSLLNADAETQEIENVLGERNVSVLKGQSASDASVLSILATAGAWVHIAAHGTAQPNRIGYAGIWLDSPQAGDAPQFLSWLDVLEQGVSADLVVLNACELGDSGDTIAGNLSFAGAVSQAGARQVVAALWPVSDTASTIWVPTFYATLIADPQHDAAAALRVAQLKLRASRMFRHPFYWAGLQSFTRLDLGHGAKIIAPVDAVAHHR
ncbi:MAG: CHAT domain-containing tetratricopeptide repeat protein [Dokdonella sp.]